MSEFQDLIKTKARVLIAIQARCDSTRFPRKIFQMLGKKTILSHVVDQAKSAKSHVERPTHKMAVICGVAVLYPTKDIEIRDAFSNCGALMIDGDENDVLSRYVKAQEITQADYVVRLTSDCPLVLDFIISKHINVAVFNQLDYVSNVDEEVRLVFDGMDVEVLSKDALLYLSKNATSAHDKEHVTTALRRDRPKHLRFGFVSSKLDSSSMKLSLDTPEDLERIRAYYHGREGKLSLALKKYGRKMIFEI